MSTFNSLTIFVIFTITMARIRHIFTVTAGISIIFSSISIIIGSITPSSPLQASSSTRLARAAPQAAQKTPCFPWFPCQSSLCPTDQVPEETDQVPELTDQVPQLSRQHPWPYLLLTWFIEWEFGPTHSKKRFNSAYLQNLFCDFIIIPSNMWGLYATFSWGPQVSMMFH